MAWIKRNLILVISGIVTLGLFALGGYYVYSANQKNTQVDQEIESAKAEIKRLLDKPVTPSAENLKSAKQEAVKLGGFITEAKKLFPPTPPPAEPLNPLSFKSLLARTVNELHQQAASSGIRIETNQGGPYYFTFEAQRLPVSFPPETLRPLSERLHEVHFIAQTLFKSKINRLVGMRRAMVPGERPTGGGAAPGGGNDYLPTPPRPNPETSMMLWPYEVVFDSFSPELAAVLEGLQSAQYGLIVKSVHVEPAPEVAVGPGGFRPPGGQGAVPVRPGRPGRPGAPVAPPPGAPAAAFSTIINEKLLRVTLRIEVIKPNNMSNNMPTQGGRGFGRPGGPP